MAGNHAPSPTPDDRNLMWDLHQQGYSHREISREVGFAPATISRYLRLMGADTDRSLTAEATAARVRKLAEKRVNLAESLMEDAFSMQHRVWDKYSQYINTAEGAELVHLEEPPLQDQNHGIKALETLVKTVDTLLDGVDTGDQDQAKNALDEIMAGLTELVGKHSDEGVGDLDQDTDYDIATDPEQQPDE